MSASPPASLQGKVAIVTGAGGAIGRATALLLALEGAAVVVNDLGTALSGDGANERPAAETVSLIQAAGGTAVASGTDIASWEGAQKVRALALDRFGRIDIVVNNAGNVRFAAFQDSEPADVDALLNVHLRGSYYMARAVAADFVKQRSGCYVHMTSSAALIGMTGNAGYIAAKMGVVGLSRAIALDMHSVGVRSNCIAPAAQSRMSPRRANAGAEAAHAAKVRPDQVAPLVVYLASDAAADINGQIFGARGNEFYLYSQPRPVGCLTSEQGWSIDALAEQLPEQWRDAMTPLEQTCNVFSSLPL